MQKKGGERCLRFELLHRFGYTERSFASFGIETRCKSSFHTGRRIPSQILSLSNIQNEETKNSPVRRIKNFDLSLHFGKWRGKEKNRRPNAGPEDAEIDYRFQS